MSPLQSLLPPSHGRSQMRGRAPDSYDVAGIRWWVGAVKRDGVGRVIAARWCRAWFLVGSQNSGRPPEQMVCSQLTALCRFWDSRWPVEGQYSVPGAVQRGSQLKMQPCWMSHLPEAQSLYFTWISYNTLQPNRECRYIKNTCLYYNTFFSVCFNFTDLIIFNDSGIQNLSQMT